MRNLNENSKIVWRKEWIQEYETPWSIFEKLAFSNSLGRNDILKEFGIQAVKKLKSNIGKKWRGFTDLDGLDENLLTAAFDFNIKQRNNIVIDNLTGLLREHYPRTRDWFCSHLRWCDKCLATGFHSWFHQFVLVNYCPYHNSELLEKCPNCSSEVPFLLSNETLGDPFICKCGYSLSNFHKMLWKSWSTSYKLINQTVLNWIGNSREKANNRKWLFIPQYGSLELLVTNSPRSKKAYLYHALKKGDSNPSLLENHNEEIFNENKELFKSIDRYLRKNLLNDHIHCIKQFMEMRNTGQVEFPDICPYAYAYALWRKTVLGKSEFYCVGCEWDDIGEHNRLYCLQLQCVTTIISEELEYLCEHFINMTSVQKVNKTQQKAQLIWILNKFSEHFCFNFFSAWLDIAEKGSSVRASPDWVSVRRMVQASISKFVFTLSTENDKLIVNFQTDKESNPVDMMIYNCPNNSRRNKRAIKKMRCYDPTSVLMDSFACPSMENKEYKKYVDEYVVRFRF